jgi:hypothetical protein
MPRRLGLSIAALLVAFEICSALPADAAELVL